MSQVVDMPALLAAVPQQIAAARAQAVQAAAADATTKDQQVQQAAASDATTKAGNAKNDAVATANQAVSVAQQAATMAAATPSRLRTKRISLPSLAAGLAGSLQVVWDTPMPSTNWTLAGCEIIGTTLLRITGITSPTAAGCTVNYLNTSIGSLLGTGVAVLHISAIHDPLTI